MWRNKMETVNYISTCNKLAPKQYKRGHDWVGKVIDLVLCKKKLKLHHTIRWYLHKPVIDDKTPKILCNLEIQTKSVI